MSFDSLEKSTHDGSRFELYRFETEDNLHIWTYTTDAKPFFFNLHNYVPEAIKRSEVKQVADGGAGQRLTIEVPFDNPVAMLHVPFLPPRPVLVTVYACQRRDSGMEVKQCFSGYITSFGQKGPVVEFSCSHVIDSQQQRVPWVVFKQGCVWALYQDGCDVPKALFAVPVEDAVESGVLLQSAAFAAKPDGWFRNGHIVNGQSGETRFITDHVGDTVTLAYPFIGYETGMSLIAYAGCDRQPTTCKDKFDNKRHYLGFDFFPTYNVFVGGVR